ncbi:MAG: DNA-binding response regulator [Magnetovibrio sp.]|nr:DNA-binding response regulator [Magnetovibrio sp.]
MNAPLLDPPHILVIDDDARLRELLVKFLSDSNFMVTGAKDAADARSRLVGLEFDLIVLDLMMPGENGLDFAQHLRKTSSVPILMLTAMNETEDRIRGLEQGADDYLGKPFEPKELVLRITNILKRRPAPKNTPSEIIMGDVTFRPARGELVCGGLPVRLTDVESALLGALAQRPGEVFSREDLISQTGANGGGRAVDVQVTRLRRKIEIDPRMPRYLQTVRGKGYVLRPD